MEQNLQVGRQLDDKVLSNAIPDERAREPGIDELPKDLPCFRTTRPQAPCHPAAKTREIPEV